MSVDEYDMKQFKELATGTIITALLIGFMHVKYESILPVSDQKEMQRKRKRKKE